MRWAARLLLAGISAGIFAVASSGPAVAAPCDPEAPAVEMPGSGWTSFMVSAPDPLPPAGDPFAPDATTTIFEQYGLAGWGYTTYDQGCNIGPASGFGDALDDGISLFADMVQMPTIFGIGLAYGFGGVAFTPASWTPVFDSPVEEIVNALREAVYDPLAWLIVAALVTWVVIKALHMQVGQALTIGGFALVCGTIALLIIANPVAWARSLDGVQAELVGSVASNVAGTSAQQPADVAMASAAVDTIMWPQYKAANFCAADNPTAERYAPDLFRAHTFTWREAAAYKADPGGAGKEILDAKNRAYEDTAAKIKSEDPVAYNCLTGSERKNRLGAAGLTFLAGLATLPLLIAGLIVMCVSLIIIRLAVIMALPLLAVGVWPQTRHLARAPLMMAVYALFNAVTFGIGTVANLAVMRALAEATLPGWLRLFLMALFTFAAWILLTPFLHLTRMIHYDPVKRFHQTYDSAKGHATGAGEAAVAIYSAELALAAKGIAGRGGKDDDEEPESVSSVPVPQAPPAAHPRPRRAVDPSYEPPPLPIEAGPSPAVPAAQAGRARRAPHYVGEDGQEVFVLYDSQTDRAEVSA